MKRKWKTTKHRHQFNEVRQAWIGVS